jgi:hypothetical protein
MGKMQLSISLPQTEQVFPSRSTSGQTDSERTDAFIKNAQQVTGKTEMNACFLTSL